MVARADKTSSDDEFLSLYDEACKKRKKDKEDYENFKIERENRDRERHERQLLLESRGQRRMR